MSNQNIQQALALPEKEVIQLHLPVRLPCYDFTPVTSPAFSIPLIVVKVTTSGMASSHSVTGGELQPAIQTEDEFLELAHPRGIATLCPVHYSTGFAACQALVRFFALHRIKPHAPPLVRALINSFEFHSCEHTVIASSPAKEVHDLWAFYLHTTLLRQAFAHCEKFPNAASRRSLGLVSVPGRFLRVTHLSATGNTTSRLTCITCIHALHIRLEFTPRNIAIPTPQVNPKSLLYILIRSRWGVRNTYKIRHYKQDDVSLLPRALRNRSDHIDIPSTQHRSSKGYRRLTKARKPGSFRKWIPIRRVHNHMDKLTLTR
ncbi:hypothetical protein J1N35_029825 [Gossypium stocksii]|uniref:Uncharacterized protein n=1 Tax=Gossypium stocksii TaxID=47602 RepID=A0A9D3ZTD4_9ROSI|nr:hypothetical protein J1N35_029825 [Gossypium stocksii]